MAVSLGRAAVDGILFSGEDAVTRADSQELQRLFGNTNVEDLDLYAHCYEWTHWSPVLTALGARFSFPYIYLYIYMYIYKKKEKYILILCICTTYRSTASGAGPNA